MVGHVSWLPLTADVPTLLYSSSEKPVATVDANGKITAVSVGTTVITVKVEGTDIEETTTVTVTEPVLVLLDNTGWTASCSDFADWTEYDENGNVGFSIDETTDVAAANVLLSIFAIAAGKDYQKVDDIPERSNIDKDLKRTTPFLTHEVFLSLIHI